MSAGFFFILLGVLFAGATLLWLALRGRRINRHPVCRACSFDLEGVYPSGVTCPECGAGLKRRRAVRIGVRRRMWVLALLSIVLISVPTGLIGLSLFAVLMGTTLNQQLPLGALLFQTRFVSDSGLSAIITEISSRVRARSLSKDQTAALVAHILQAQSDLSSRWSPEWGDLFESLHAGGDATDADRERYNTRGPVLQLRHRSRVRPGDALPVRIDVVESRFGSGPPVRGPVWLAAPQWKLAMGAPTPRDTSRRLFGNAFGSLDSDFSSGWAGSLTVAGRGSAAAEPPFTIDLRCPRHAAPGTQTLDLQAKFAPFRYSIAAPTPGQGGFTTVGGPAEIQVMPPGRDSVDAIAPSEALQKTLADALRPTEASITVPPGRDPSVTTRVLPPGAIDWINLTIETTWLPPVGLSFDVYVVHSQSEHRIGRLVLGPDPSQRPRNIVLKNSLWALPSPTVDLAFVPNPDYARATVDIDSYFGGRVQVRGITVANVPRSEPPAAAPASPTP